MTDFTPQTASLPGLVVNGGAPGTVIDVKPGSYSFGDVYVQGIYEGLITVSVAEELLKPSLNGRTGNSDVFTDAETTLIGYFWFATVGTFTIKNFIQSSTEYTPVAEPIYGDAGGTSLTLTDGNLLTLNASNSYYAIFRTTNTNHSFGSVTTAT